MKRSIFYLISLFLLFSCRTPTPAPPVRTLEEVTISEIQTMIYSEEPTKALQWIIGLRTSTSPVKIHPDELERLEKEAKEKIIEKFYQAIEASDFSYALSLYSSFRTLYGSGGFPEYSVDRLKFLLAETERQKGNTVLALTHFRGMSDWGMLSPEELTKYARLALDLKNLPACRTILKELERRNLVVPKDLKEASLQNIPLADYLAGTVTIWVNRGIRMDRGVGVPDRVIGSGFYIDPRGYLLTNYHVIQSEVDPEYEGYSRLFIRPSGRIDERIPAKVIGFDRIFDIALLKAEVNPPFLFGITDVQELRVGSRIYALGSPGGLENTITSGIISAVGRRFFQLGDAMQMDVPVNPGSSGGPLIDEEGRLIGIVFAGIEQFQGVNFAIPAYWIQKILPSLYTPGEVVHSWMGVSVQEVREGLEVLYVAPGSPAYEVGIQRGDQIRQIGDTTVYKVRDAQSVLLSQRPGTLLRVSVQRKDETKSYILALQKRPYIPLEKVIEFERKENLFPALFGFTARSLSSGLFSDDFIVEKVYQGSVADETGLSENDPFTLRNWIVDKKKRLVLMQITIKQRKAGFLEGGVQLGALLEQNNFL
ncbi:MAG: S1C family serine protease [Spirochaetes bacterium]|nr:S1C family serine protease [Spirochaetota bacterium]